jgi:hypothetical protein
MDNHASILLPPKITHRIQKKVAVTWRAVFDHDKTSSLQGTGQSTQKVPSLLVPKDISTLLLEGTLQNFTTSIATLPMYKKFSKTSFLGNS